MKSFPKLQRAKYEGDVYVNAYWLEVNGSNLMETFGRTRESSIDLCKLVILTVINLSHTLMSYPASDFQ
jgi:hypothetical protein